MKKTVIIKPKAPLDVSDSNAEDSDAEDSMPEAPRLHRRVIDSDIEMVEAIADGLASIPLVGRSRRSSSASSGHLSLPVIEMESDDELEPKQETVHTERNEKATRQKTVRKISAARQKQADLEKPAVHPSSVRPAGTGKGKAVVESANDASMSRRDLIGTSNRPESSWDPSERLVLPAPNKDIGLTAQHPELQFVLRSTIALIKTSLHCSLLFHEAYPTMISRAGWGRPYMIEAAGLRPSSCHILERLLIDSQFGAVLAPIPLDRIHIPPQPSLPPWLHPENIDKFPATSKGKPAERELPDAMVALTATAVYAALLELRMTGQRQNIVFTEDAYEDMYHNHMASLETARSGAPHSVHELMHTLFKEVNPSNKTIHTTSGSSFTLMQLIDLPQSD
ncbi:hypothetical protein DFH09DRAFT_1317647 [Mycena vulgaris]|nr:hypothetical protein DFH09DRAFT_1317647 [Mycena vulgaris]